MVYGIILNHSLEFKDYNNDLNMFEATLTTDKWSGFNPVMENMFVKQLPKEVLVKQHNTLPKTDLNKTNLDVLRYVPLVTH